MQSNFRALHLSDRASKMRKEVALWIAPEDSSKDLSRRQKQRDPSSCRWLLQKGIYHEWLTNTNSTVLWIHGIPGSGKPFLASFIIDDIIKRFQTNAAVIYFFCSGRNESKSASISILRSVIYQLQMLLPSASGVVEDAFQKSTHSVAQYEELWDMFCGLVAIGKTVYCVIDGLDECSGTSDYGNIDRSLFARSLVDLTENLGSDCKFKVLFSSRNEPDIRLAFKSVDRISITKEDIDLDIASYTENLVGRSEILCDLEDDLKGRIIKQLQQNSAGMFIWVRLTVEELEMQASPEGIEKALNLLPHDLQDLYDQIFSKLLTRVRKRDGVRDMAAFILRWVVYAARALTLSELAEIRALTPGQPNLSEVRRPFSF